MQKEQQIIGMLEKIMKKQEEHSSLLKEHSAILKEHSSILNEHSGILNEHSDILNEHSGILNEHSQKHDNHSAQLKENGQILSALRSGQEYLKAEINGMKITNAKEFENLNEKISDISVNQELLRDDVWTNKVDIHRIKNTLGMK